MSSQDKNWNKISNDTVNLVRVLELLLVHVAIFVFLVYFLAAFTPDPARSRGENRQRSAAIVRGSEGFSCNLYERTHDIELLIFFCCVGVKLP